MNFSKGKENTSPAVAMIRVWDERGLKITLLFALAFIIIFQTCLLPIANSASFTMPEKFIYDLTWTGIKAGTASLELRNNGEKVTILSTAQSSAWVSAFYTVDDRVESTLLKKSLESFFQPSQYRIRIREGRYRRDKEIIFDHDKNTATYIDRLKNEKKDFPITVLRSSTHYPVSTTSDHWNSPLDNLYISRSLTAKKSGMSRCRF